MRENIREGGGHTPINARKYIEQALQIRSKEGQIIPLRLNRAQEKLYSALAAQHEAGRPMRAIVLKARQMGCSTLMQALVFQRTASRPGVQSAVVAHKEESANHLFGMSKLFYQRLPQRLRPACRTANARQLIFDTPEGEGLQSSIRCMTAGGPGIGRGDTFQNLHLSEFAYWPGDKRQTLAGLLQAVPDRPDTLVVIESTANGFDEFKQLWDRAAAGESDFAPVFCPWWEQPEYRRRAPAGTAWTREERQLAEEYGLDEEQLSWRRWCIENNCGGDAELFRQEYPACPAEAFLSTGSCIFDKAAVAARLAAATRPVRRGGFVWQENAGGFAPGDFCDDARGPVRVYEEPRAGVPYVIGADTAGEGSDWFVAQVIDNTTGAQAAVLRQRFDEDEFARQVCCLGWWYNTALLAIEANFSTYPIREAERLGYPFQYTRESEDNYTHRLQRRYGFKTTSLTRPPAIAGLVRVMREAPETVRDANTLREMLAFVKNERGRPEAMAGEHDDCVMALAIAHYCRGQQSCLPRQPGAEEGPGAEFDRQARRLAEY